MVVKCDIAQQRTLENQGWKTNELEQSEDNNATTTVDNRPRHDLRVPNDRLNSHRPACAPGNPVGATGAPILGALINGLQVNGLKRGPAAIRPPGAEPTAMAVELAK